MNTNGLTRGFTIVELLIVIVVIGILAGLTMITFNGVQVRARNAQVLSGVKTIESAMRQYATLNQRYITPTVSCLGTGYATNRCKTDSTTANPTWGAVQDTTGMTELSTVIPNQPKVNDGTLRVFSASDDLRGGVWKHGNDLKYYLEGDQSCRSGETKTFAGQLTECVLTLPAPG
jgi:prepilin-type N-terminal cleavage/methylation domain-containing protein